MTDSATIVLEPPNVLPRIERIFAFLSVDESGSEGVCAAFRPEFGWMPLIAADEARLAALRRIAAELARESGRRIVLARFETRVDEEEIAP